MICLLALPDSNFDFVEYVSFAGIGGSLTKTLQNILQIIYCPFIEIAQIWYE